MVTSHKTFSASALRDYLQQRIAQDFIPETIRPLLRKLSHFGIGLCKVVLGLTMLANLLIHYVAWPMPSNVKHVLSWKIRVLRTLTHAALNWVLIPVNHRLTELEAIARA